MYGTDASLDYWNQNKYQVDPVGSTGNAYSGFGSGGASDVYGNPITGNEFNFNNSTGFDPGFWDASLNATTNLNQNQNQNSIWGGHEVNPSESFQSTIPQYGQTTTKQGKASNQFGFGQIGFGQNYNRVQGSLDDPNLLPWQRKMLETQGGGGLLSFTGTDTTGTDTTGTDTTGTGTIGTGTIGTGTIGTGTIGTGTIGTVGQVDTAGSGVPLSSGVPPTVAAPELTPEQLQHQARVKALSSAGQSMSKFGSSMLGNEYEYNMFG